MKPFLIPDQLIAHLVFGLKNMADFTVRSNSSKAIVQNQFLNEFQMENRAYLKYQWLLMRFGSSERSKHLQINLIELSPDWSSRLVCLKA